MTKEIDRCRWALEKANTGRRVVMVCSGDAGVYGMASPVLELEMGIRDSPRTACRCRGIGLLRLCKKSS